MASIRAVSADTVVVNADTVVVNVSMSCRDGDGGDGHAVLADGALDGAHGNHGTLCAENYISRAVTRATRPATVLCKSLIVASCDSMSPTAFCKHPYMTA